MKPELKVGLTVFSAVLLLWLVIWWAKDVKVGQKTASILFDNVSGLLVGDAVTVRGTKAGKVESIQIAKNGVLVKVSIVPEVTLYQNAYAKLSMLELMSGKRVELFPGTNDTSELTESDIIKGSFSADIPSLVGFAGEAVDTLRYLVYDLQQTLRSVNLVLGDDGFREDLKVSVHNLRLITDDVKRVSGELRESNLRGLLSKVDQTLTTINTLISSLEPQLKGAVGDVRTTVKNADELVLSLKVLSDKLQSDKTSLAGKLLNDTAFSARIDSVVQHLNEVLKLGEKEGINVKLRVF